jgi:molecular chaperone DnaJ
MSKDYYEILGVNKSASKEEIKKAFHKLAHTHHPDKNGGDDKKFKEVNEAYQILSDDKKRESYDRFGNPDMGGFNSSYGNSGFGGFDFTGGNGGVEFDLGDLGEIFGDFFGGASSRNRSKTKKGKDLETSINLSFEESIFGVSKRIKLDKISICEKCKGSGAKDDTKMSVCKNCEGHGQIKEIKRSILGSFQTTRTCESCNGSGKIPEEKCSICKGAGVYRHEEEIEINIPSGIENGQILRVSEKGEAVKGGKSGDLYVRITVKNHSTYKRDGDNLITDISVKLTDAILGSIYKIKTLEGSILEVKIPEGINNGQMLRIKGRGVPLINGRGDIILNIKVIMPSKISKKAKELINKLKEEGI